MNKDEWTQAQIEDALNSLVERRLLVKMGEGYYVPQKVDRSPPWSRPLSAEQRAEQRQNIKQRRINLC